MSLTGKPSGLWSLPADHHSPPSIWLRSVGWWASPERLKRGSALPPLRGAPASPSAFSRLLTSQTAVTPALRHPTHDACTPHKCTAGTIPQTTHHTHTHTPHVPYHIPHHSNITHRHTQTSHIQHKYHIPHHTHHTCISHTPHTYYPPHTHRIYRITPHTHTACNTSHTTPTHTTDTHHSTHIIHHTTHTIYCIAHHTIPLIIHHTTQTHSTAHSHFTHTAQTPIPHHIYHTAHTGHTHPHTHTLYKPHTHISHTEHTHHIPHHTRTSKQTVYAAYKLQASWNLLRWTQVSPGLPSTLTRDRLPQDKRNVTLPGASAHMGAENLSGPWGRVNPDLKGCGRLSGG